MASYSGMQITAFGRTLTSHVWAREPVCVVSRRTLEQRVRDGWSPEDALSTPAQRKLEPARQLVNYRGVQFERKPNKSGQYVALIWVGGKLRKLGRFLSAEEAARAYNRALRNANSPDRQNFNILEPMF